jgi:hypothetical protein
MAVAVKRVLPLICLALAVAGLAGCGKAASTAGFKGEEHEVAQTIANLQSDATSANEHKICTEELSSRLVARLNLAHGGCEQTIKDQLTAVDNFEVTIQSVALAPNARAQAPNARPQAPNARAQTANARVKGIHAGKTRADTLMLVKEGGKWKLAGIQ